MKTNLQRLEVSDEDFPFFVKCIVVWASRSRWLLLKLLPLFFSLTSVNSCRCLICAAFVNSCSSFLASYQHLLSFLSDGLFTEIWSQLWIKFSFNFQIHSDIIGFAPPTLMGEQWDSDPPSSGPQSFVVQLVLEAKVLIYSLRARLLSLAFNSLKYSLWCPYTLSPTSTKYKPKTSRFFS